MTFDHNTNPELIASRAAELALEQLDRYRSYSAAKGHADATDSKTAIEFYSDPFEVGISNNIGRLMAAYAVLKGYVTEEQAGVKN